MDWVPRRRWTALALLAGACGPVVGDPMVVASADGESTHVGDDDGTTAGADVSGSTGTTAAADESSSSGEPVALVCGALDPATPVALVTNESDAAVLRGDGSLVDLDIPVIPPSSDASSYAVLAARGSRIAVTRIWTTFVDDVDYESELTLLAEDGTRIWSHTEYDRALSTPYVAEDGAIVTARNDEDGAFDSALYVEGGDAIAMERFQPNGPRRDDGWVPGLEYTDEGSVVPGWREPIAELAQSIRYSPLYTWTPRNDGSFVYFTEGEAGPSLVRDTPQQAEVIELPELAGVSPTTIQLWFSPSRAWMLLQDGTTAAWWRIDVDGGTAEPIELDPPPGSSMFECYSPSVVIDDVGRLLLATRDEAAATILRRSPGEREWEQLGEPITLVDDIHASVFGDTYLVQTSGIGTTFCPPQSFEPSAVALAGTTLQVVRPSDAVSLVLPADSVYPMPSTDGTCIGLVGADGLRVRDLLSDAELVLPKYTNVVWWSR